ncbi:MAG: ABC transporter permease subunit [Comamonadaceae bacterium]|nr:ABC transporter permease subunit [Burkholderiales bacterium]MEB2349311.1 ABC transporter permease subunit [Comamonadaceae bacterium]
MAWIRTWLGGVPRYLWGGWGAIASLLLMVALWEALAAHYGPLVLPTPLEAADTLAAWAERGGTLWPTLLVTARRAFFGLALAVAVGSVLGVAAGVSMTAAVMARPWATVLLGTPPIAWLVLAMLWFGTGDGTPVFTVFIACFPIVFVGGMQGARTLDQHWRDVARAYHLPWRMRVMDVYLPHVVSYLFPAWIVALGSSWKVVVMAELLASDNGVGAALASTRAQLDMAGTLAWIGAVVLVLLALEYLLLEPIKREIERWRDGGAAGERV